MIGCHVPGPHHHSLILWYHRENSIHAISKVDEPKWIKTKVLANKIPERDESPNARHGYRKESRKREKKMKEICHPILADKATVSLLSAPHLPREVAPC
jgi:hypothetical protein